MNKRVKEEKADEIYNAKAEEPELTNSYGLLQSKE